MFAVIRTGGKQYRVAAEDLIKVDKVRGSHVGADAYLTKPFDPNEMIRVVRELAGVP